VLVLFSISLKHFVFVIFGHAFSWHGSDKGQELATPIGNANGGMLELPLSFEFACLIG